MFNVAVRTVPARQELFASLMTQLVKAVPSTLVHGIHVSSRTDVTPNENACLALHSVRPDASWTIFLEDDAGLIDDFFGSVQRWLAVHARPDVHLYPLGAAYSSQFPKDRHVWEYPISAYYCSVAFVLRTDWVSSAVGYMRMNSHVHQGFDLMMGHWHRTVSASEYFYTPVPCFVDHLGDESTLIDGRPGRNVVGRFCGFRGYDYSYQPEAANG